MIVWLKKFLNGKMPVLFHDYYIIYLKKKIIEELQCRIRYYTNEFFLIYYNVTSNYILFIVLRLFFKLSQFFF